MEAMSLAVSSEIPLSFQSQTVLAAAVSGPVLYALVFRRGEWHMQAPTLLTTWLLATAILVAVAAKYDEERAQASLQTIFYALTAFICSVYCSIGIYRVFFHRLRSYPGPLTAKCSKFWHFYKCLKAPQYRVLDELYDQHGEFVRTGPRELMVIHPDILHLTASVDNGCGKTDWYDLLQPSRAIIASRDRAAHDNRRRIWERALDAKNRTEYSQRVLDHINKLDVSLRKAAAAGEPVLVDQLFAWFSFDLMGLFAFGRTFGMLENEEWHDAILQLRRGLGALGVLSCMPWLARIGFAYIPGLWIVKDWFQMRRFCEERMNERMATEGKADIASHLIKAAQKNGFSKEDREWLDGDALTLIIGGSDTTSATLTFLFYRLAANTDLTERLHHELKGVHIEDRVALVRLPLLNGVISETLRLHPALPSAVYRETPPSGLMVGERFIPGGTKILAPRWTIARLESGFEDAEAFIPERWFSRSEMVRNRNAYSPFGFGRWSCVGKNIALDNIRCVIARLVSTYRVSFGPGETGEALERDLQDGVVAIPGELRLSFQLRIPESTFNYTF